MSVEIKPSPDSERVNSIGALRLLLASLVIYSHAHFLGGFGQEWLVRWTNGSIGLGSFAVQCFFVLSGWLITKSWMRRPSLIPFLWNRFLRLAPALWICLAVTAFLLTPLVYWTHAPDGPAFFSQEPSALGYLFRNLVFTRTQIAVGTVLDSTPWPGDWNGSLWTLSYEACCYLMVAAMGLGGLLGRWRVLGTALILALLLLHPLWAERATLGLPLPDITAKLYDTPGKLVTLHFLSGSLWAVWPGITAEWSRKYWLTFGAFTVLIFSWRLGFHAWLSPLVLPPAVLGFAFHGAFPDWERRLGGDYSYGLYVYGYPVQQTLAHFHAHELGFLVYLLLSFLCTGVLAFSSWRWVESPALAMKRLACPKKPTVPA